MNIHVHGVDNYVLYLRLDSSLVTELYSYILHYRYVHWRPYASHGTKMTDDDEDEDDDCRLLFLSCVGVIFLSTDDKMVCLDPHYCQSAVDMSKDDFPTQVNLLLTYD